MRIGVDVGGTNTDAVLMNGATVVAWTKQPTSADVGTGVAAAITAVLGDARVAPGAIASVMIGTTHFTNALVERSRLDRVGILRLASPSGEALPPMTGWPEALAGQIDARTYLLPGGFEFDGREIAPLDPAAIRAAARELRDAGIDSIAISSVFAPVNPAMEDRAAALVAEEHPDARITVSHTLGRIGFIERENATILNAALGSLATHVVASFERALAEIGIDAPLYLSQNDGTLISAARAAAYPVLTIGSGPTNSMRGAAFLSGVRDAIVLDVGGTTTDIGVLANGFPRESSVAVDIGGVRINFRMPDILALGLGGGTRIHLDPALYGTDAIDADDLRVGPDSVGFRITEQAWLFGGATLTTSDVAVAAGRAEFGDPALLPPLSDAVRDAVWARMQAMLEEAVDRMKTSRGDVLLLAVGGGNFLVPDTLRGAARVVRPRHAAVANAVGAAIAQVGAQVEQVVSYEREPRATALDRLRAEAVAQAIAAGGIPDSVEIVEMDEVYLTYLPGRAAQVRVRAVADLAGTPALVAHAH
ncbi:hydantoinase/oxoprolinase N-terminal domain-containing protein [Sphingomonas hengshuiensis]|uniref:Hydantoinase subunit beta n=1 Tax=Sphingomonas hengshuiensis TaxID=1609977 RepID=A0A7U4J8A7_9SPHN|nr:hydantoinase/oxoprolinase family protein [Sphingomonas hengshuiensis]AJP72100.1 hydantoinase subunit beta [Sphingomonas hengshuiensis]